MTEVTTDLDVLEAARRLMPANTEFTMLNLLRYRPQAEYHRQDGTAPISGRKAYYERYVPPTFKIIRRLGGGVFWFGHIQVPIYGRSDEKWDDVLLVRYPSFEALVALIGDPEYQANVHHRMAALADTRVLATLTGKEIA